jgi:hypothetical protein
MSDLNLGPASQSSPVKPLAAALVLLLLVGVLVYYLNPRQTAVLTLPGVQLYPTHTVFAAPPGAVHIIGHTQRAEDDLYVIATVHLENKLRLPIFIVSVDATCTAPDGSVLDARAPAPSSLARVEESFPALTPLISNPLSFDPAIGPGATTEGAVLLQFPGLTEATWKARKSATLTVNLAHQQPQTIAIP